jgi:MFS family permease
VVRTATLSAGFGMGSLIGLSVYVPVYLQAVAGLSPGYSGLGLIPLLGGTVIGATFSGRRMARLAHYKRVPLVGLACGAVALCVLAVAPTLPVPASAALLAVMGLGCGSLFPVTTVSLQNAVHPHQLGTATAALNFFRQLGGAILVAAFGTILLAGIGTTDAGGRAADVLARVGGGEGVDLAHAFRWVFLAAALCLATAVGFLFLMEERPLRDRPAEDATGNQTRS